jgi:FkbM family methyltransferase
MSQNSYFSTLSFRQKIRWFLHLGKAKYKHKERSTCAALAEHFPPGSTIYDVGAHFGILAKEFAAVHDGQTRVVAFEPGEYCLSILKRVVGNLSTVEIVELGVAEAEGNSELKTPIKDSGLMGIGLSQVGGTSDVEHIATSISLTSLDSYRRTSGSNDVTFIKVDVEGGELGVLKGAIETIKDCRPTWYIEIDANMTRRYGHSPDAVFDLLFASKYRAFTTNEDGSWSQVDGFHGTNDYLFKV